MEVSFWTWARLFTALIFLSASYSLSTSIDLNELRDMNKSEVTECHWTEGGRVCMQSYKFMGVDTGIPLAFSSRGLQDKGFFELWGMVKEERSLKE